MPHEHTQHQYETTTSLHGTLLTPGVYGFLGSAPHPNPSLIHIYGAETREAESYSRHHPSKTTSIVTNRTTPHVLSSPESN
jgi:hypothetical protein